MPRVTWSPGQDTYDNNKFTVSHIRVLSHDLVYLSQRDVEQVRTNDVMKFGLAGVSLAN